MGAIKELGIWFNEKYNEFDDDIGRWTEKYGLYLTTPPIEKGIGIRIVLWMRGDDTHMSYMQDYFEGSDYEKDLEPRDMFYKVTGFIDDMMENMPK